MLSIIHSLILKYSGPFSNVTKEYKKRSDYRDDSEPHLNMDWNPYDVNKDKFTHRHPRKGEINSGCDSYCECTNKYEYNSALYSDYNHRILPFDGYKSEIWTKPASKRIHKLSYMHTFTWDDFEDIVAGRIPRNY